MRPHRIAPVLLAVLGLAGCVHVFHRDRVEEVAPPQTLGEVSLVQTPLRVHRADGSIVVFPEGARISRHAIQGRAIAYSLGLRDSTAVDRVDLDDVIGVEAFRREVNAPASLLVSVLATVSIPAALFAVACAADPKCFGSCPTIYSTAAGDTTLEAELFSYSIAPLLEGRDVDVIHAPVSGGVLRLDVRNEALETHFINHLEILEVLHAADERVVPDHAELPLVLGPLVEPAAARAGDGGDALAAVRARDAHAYETAEARVAAAMDGGDLADHIDLEWPRPRDADTAAIALRMRNSLLTSVLFYDLMLGEAGPRALEWMGDELQQIGSAVQLGSWWSRRMGLRVSILTASGWREVARVPDSGPIAWTEVAVPIPVSDVDGDTVRARISFAADQWRIDQVALARWARRAPSRTVPLARMLRGDGAPDAIGRDALGAPDARYVETTAGTRFVAEFDVGAAPASGGRTLMLASQGFYNEWIRPSWIRRSPRGSAFVASDETLRRAMRLWLPIRSDYQARFMATRIPVR